jgi:putative membrane protein
VAHAPETRAHVKHQPEREPSPAWPLALLAVFVLWWGALAIAPHYREDWLLENVMVFLAVPALVLGWRNLRFSNTAYTLLFVFFALHELGAHYTYSEVPYDRWATQLFGRSIDDVFGFERTQFDRVVHFLYGVLITPAAIELLDAKAPQRGVWRWLLPILFMMSHAVVYETIEWFAAEVFGGELGQAYLGTQGDVWDAQKDMALAGLGAIIAVVAVRLSRRPGG